MKFYLLLSSFILLLTAKLQGQPGSLVPGFGNNGHALADFSASNRYDEAVTKILIQADGKRVAVVDRYPYLQCIRFNADGSYDASYGQGGFSQAANLRFFNRGSNAAIQADGKIVATGETEYNQTTQTDMGVARWNTDGTLDASFGTGGIVITDFGYWEEGQILALQPDGKILVAGETLINNHTYLAFARYNSNGTLDGSFGAGGRHVNPIFDGVGLTDMELAPDGKIIVLGGDFGSSDDFVIARFLFTGPIDASFTTDGYEDYNWPGGMNAGMSSLKVQPDGKMIVGGFAYNGINSDFAIARYNANGTIDAGFHGDGVQTTHIGGSETIFDIALQADGKIVVAGQVFYGNQIPSQFASGRYLSNGELDNTYGFHGTQITGFGGYESAAAFSVAIHADGDISIGGVASKKFNGDIAIATYDVQGVGDQNGYAVQRVIAFYADNGLTFFRASAVQPDGKLLTAGYAWNGTDYDFIVARWNTNGTLDPTFGNNGFQKTDFGGAPFEMADEFAEEVIIQPDGKIVLVGTFQGNDIFFAIARYNSDGSLDNSFDGDGLQLVDFPGIFERGHAAVLQPDGKIVVGGEVDNADFDLALFRLNSDGTLDAGFGKVVTNFGYQDIIFDMVLQTDGKIVVTGNTSLPNSFLGFDFNTVRYNSDGTIDNGFGTNGSVTTDFDDGLDFAQSIAIQTDGKIIVAGEVPVGNDFKFGLARYNSNGTPDAGFGTGGKVTTDFNAADGAYAVELQADGKIVVAGVTSDNNPEDNQREYDIALARYNTNGTLNECFGDRGKVTSDFGEREIAYTLTIFNDIIYVAGYQRTFNFFALADKFYGLVAAYNRTGGALSITCPPNGLVQVNADAGLCAAVVNDHIVDPLVCPDDAAATINYTIQRNNVVVESGTGTVKGKSFPVGQSTVIYTVASNPALTCNFIIEVLDNEAPVISCPQTQTLGLEANCSVVLPDYRSQVTADDNCTAPNLIQLSQSPVPGTLVSGLGSLIVTITATDAAGNTTTPGCSFTVNKMDLSGPAITCPANVIVNAPANACSATITPAMIGTATATDNCPGLITVGHSPFATSNVYPVGQTLITWTATDANGNPSMCTQTITVVDNQFPTITNIAVSPTVLTPPNHQMRNITVNYTLGDNCPGTTAVLSVTSNEPQSGTGNGDQTPDWIITGPNSLELRAERNGQGNGRIYTITISASDAYGNITTATRTVTVPKNNSQNRNGEEEVITVNPLHGQLEVTALPNPSKTNFTIRMKASNLAESINVNVTDMYGRLIETRKVLADHVFTLGNTYRPGTYIVHFIQGKEHKQIKLIKLSD